MNLKALLLGSALAMLPLAAHASDTCTNGTVQEAMEAATKLNMTSVVFTKLDKDDEGTKALYQKLRDTVTGGDSEKLTQFDELIIFKKPEGDGTFSYSGIAFKGGCAVAGGGLLEEAFNSMKLLASGT